MKILLLVYSVRMDYPIKVLTLIAWWYGQPCSVHDSEAHGLNPDNRKKKLICFVIVHTKYEPSDNDVYLSMCKS